MKVIDAASSSSVGGGNGNNSRPTTPAGSRGRGSNNLLLAKFRCFILFLTAFSHKLEEVDHFCSPRLQAELDFDLFLDFDLDRCLDFDREFGAHLLLNSESLIISIATPRLASLILWVT